MEIHELQAEPRTEQGSRACRRLRREGLIPAVLYGRGQENVVLSVRVADIETLLEEHAHIVRLVWDGHQDNAQIRDVDYDALGDNILHLNLVRISMSETVTVSIPVDLHGEPAGVTEGGVMELLQYAVEVECLPTAIPDEIRVEVGQLAIGDSLRIEDIVFPEGVTPTEDPEAVVVVIVPPEEEEEEEEAPEELLAEPEVIGRAAEEEEAESDEE
jgi:large subunit ribosomal protein L25